MKALDGNREDAGINPVLREFWDVGEEFVTRPPNLGKASTARVLQALVMLRGKLHNSVAFGTSDMPPHCRDVVYRISLPPGSKERFEEMTGYILTRPPTIKGA